MPFIPLASLLPEVAREETRSLHRFDGGLDGARRSHHFVEFFCDEPGCDCRRVFVHVLDDDATEPLATISWGWEPDQFYRDWANFPLSPDDLEELRGPALVRLTPQSEQAPQLLADFRTLLADQGYAARIARHYHQFREIIDEGRTAEPLHTPGNRAERRRLKSESRRKPRVRRG
jgi:hypothetical protein